MKSLNKVLLNIALGLLTCVSIIGTLQAGDINGSLEFGSKMRTYLLHVPVGYDAQNPTPLVVVFHGLTRTGPEVADISGFSPIADEENFIVVYPDGWNKKWASPGGSIDDVGFVSALIDALSSDYNINANQIYAAGVSNGGMFTYRLALELTNVFASIGNVAGYLPAYAPDPLPVPSRAISVVHFHGTTDPVIPYEQSEAAVEFWVDNNACSATPVVTSLPDTDPGDGTTVDQLVYGSCAANTGVELYKIYNGDHTWPGTSSNLMTGTICKDINASEIMWEFFKAHPLNTLPAVDFIKPAMNALFTAPALVKMKASASDPDGTITKVEFYNGAIKLKKDMTAPYNYNWQNVPAGTYLLRAIATDNLGGIAEDSVTITVNPQKETFVNTESMSFKVFYDINGRQLTIDNSSDEALYDIFIYDGCGNQIQDIQNIHESLKSISASEFTGGVYFYSIRIHGDEHLTGKFIVIQ